MNIAWFRELHKKDVNLVGGKGASLAEMYNANFPIPPGFCITAEAFKNFLINNNIRDKINSMLKDLNVEDNEALQRIAREIQQIILNEGMSNELKEEIIENYDNLNIDKEVFKEVRKEAMDVIRAGKEPPYVAVRSSATAEDLPTASFAGQQATFLNVKGNNNLLQAVKACWASLYTARAIYYRVKNNFPHEKVYIAVIIQKQIHAKKAGVIFSVNPVNEESNEILIEAGFGLGEAVVSGSINPDRYIVDKTTLAIKEKKIGNQDFVIMLDVNLNKNVKRKISNGNMQKLTEEEIKQLAEWTRKIEDHYKAPQDIEFAIENSHVYIVQSRPITTLKKAKSVKESEEKQDIKGEIILEGEPASPGVKSGKVKIVHNVDELGKVEEGDIMVTRMTNPDMVVSMKRAGAIITDTGGSSCFSKDTKILTNLGFMDFEEVYKSLEKWEKLLTLSLNTKNNKICWRPILAIFKRKSNLWKLQISPSLRSNQNFLKVTPDHKFITIKNRKLIKKRIDKIIENKEGILIVDKINNLLYNNISKEEAYLCGAIFSDGSLNINKRRGYITSFTQSCTSRKEKFIQSIRDSFKNLYNENLNEYYRSDDGTISLNCYKKNIYSRLMRLRLNIIPLILSMKEENVLAFLGGFIDGDGSIGHHQINITVGANKIELLKGLVCACLRTGTIFNIHKVKRDNCYTINFTENTDKLLKYSKKIKGNIKSKRFGNKWFLSKQIISDIIDDVNYRGRIKHPYLSNNLMISDKYLRKKIMHRVEKKKEEFEKLLKSDFRMWRVKFEEDIGKEDVYNIEIVANTELDHNYIVFTSRYTPIIVGNCHAAIVSREMGISCVVGTGKATQILKDGDIVTVDGSNGKIYKGKIEIKEEKQEIKEAIDYDTITQIKLIMDLPDVAEEAAKKVKVDGVGLLRLEMMIAENKIHPGKYIKEGRDEEYIKMLEEDIGKIARAFEGKPIWVRTSDMRTDEYRNLEGGEDEAREANPMLGLHGIRKAIVMPRILKAEFKAIKNLHDKGLTNVGVMIPFVINLEEVKKAKEIMREIGLEPCEEIEFGVMIETPASCMIIEDICKEGIDFISFGTNDLTQLTLGLDRNNHNIDQWFNELHPAILKEIEMVIKTCRKYNIETSICGQAGSEPKMAEFLVKIGIDSISVNVDAVNEIRNMVAHTERRMLLNAARKNVTN